MTKPRPAVAIIGGGYGGINVAKALDEHVDVTLIEARKAFHHNVAALRGLVDPHWLERIFLPYGQLLVHGSVRHDAAVYVDVGRIELASGTRLRPEFIVLATGSAYPFPAKSAHIEPADAIDDYRKLHDRLAIADRIMLLGAGAVGIELAGEIAAAWPRKKIILVDLADDILPGGYQPALRDELRGQLASLGVEFVLGSSLIRPPRVAPGELTPFTVATRDATTIEADLWLQAHGVTPQTSYLGGELAAARTEDGHIAVTPDMRVVGTEAVYALGDVTAIDANKAGVAGRQAQIVAANIRAQIDGGDRVHYVAGPPSIVLPLGPNGGAGQVPNSNDILPASRVAELKGRDMLIDRYLQILGITASR
jgi:NADH dehydrogenase FAD-containing subunit